MVHIYSLACKFRYFRSEFYIEFYAVLCFRESCPFSFNANDLKIKLPQCGRLLSECTYLLSEVCENNNLGKRPFLCAKLLLLISTKYNTGSTEKENLSARFLVPPSSQVKHEISLCKGPSGDKKFLMSRLSHSTLSVLRASQYVQIQTQTTCSFQNIAEHSSGCHSQAKRD